MKRSLLFLLSIIFLFLSCRKTNLKFENFGVVYGKISPVQAENYNLLILEPDHYRKYEIEAFKNAGIQVLGYVSLGEVNPDRWYYPLIPGNYFYGKNPNWNAYFLDVSQQKVVDLFLNKIIPNILARGFDGLFFDTVDDVAPGTQGQHLKHNMVELIRKIRSRFPNIIIIQNAGLFLVDQVADVIDGILIEDVVSHYDFDNKQYSIKPREEIDATIKQMTQIWTRFELPILVVDFAENNTLKKEMSKILRHYKFPYFISTIDLQKLPDQK